MLPWTYHIRISPDLKNSAVVCFTFELDTKAPMIIGPDHVNVTVYKGDDVLLDCKAERAIAWQWNKRGENMNALPTTGIMNAEMWHSYLNKIIWTRSLQSYRFYIQDTVYNKCVYTCKE